MAVSEVHDCIGVLGLFLPLLALKALTPNDSRVLGREGDALQLSFAVVVTKREENEQRLFPSR